MAKKRAANQPEPSDGLTRKQRFRPISNGRRAKQTKARMLAEYASAGAPPEDPLKAQTWTFQAMSVAMFHIMNDPNIDEAARRKEMRETARVMRELIPSNRLARAEAQVAGETAKMKGDDAGPKMTAAAPVATRVRRARPRKSN